jgi:hypothetical protein
MEHLSTFAVSGDCDLPRVYPFQYYKASLEMGFVPSFA